MTEQPRRQRSLLLVTLAVCACPSSSGDASPSSQASPGGADPHSEASPSDDASPSANASAPGACVEAELLDCVEACWLGRSGSACLEWCAGPACAAALTEAHACIGPKLASFEANSPPPDECDCTNKDCFGEAEEADAWYASRDQALVKAWAADCASACKASLAPAGGEQFCQWNDFQASKWEALAQHEPSDADVGMLGAMAAMGPGPLATLGSSLPGIHLSEAAHGSIEHPSAVKDLLRQRPLALEPCLPEGKDELDVAAVLAFAPDGSLRELSVDASAPAGACVTKALRDADLRLPPRVASAVGEVEIIVHVELLGGL